MTALVDVVVPVYADVDGTRRCLESVLKHSEGLGRLLVVDDCGPDAAMRPMLRALRDAHPIIHLLENPKNLGFIGACNRGIALRRADVLILNSDTLVTPGWLPELVEVLHSDVRIAAVCPLSNNAAACSVPEFMDGSALGSVDPTARDRSGLPRWTELPTGVGFCMLLRSSLLDLVGPFDPAYGRGYNEENDWSQRVRNHGFIIARANRAFVHHAGEVSFAGERAVRDEHNAHRLVARYPHYLSSNQQFRARPEARIAASAMRGRPRVLLEIADGSTPLVPDGEFEVTVRTDVAASLTGYDIVHRVGLPETRGELLRLLEAPGHLVVSWSDVALFADDAARADWSTVVRARALQLACLEAAQRVVVPSLFAAAWAGVPSVLVRSMGELLPPAAEPHPRALVHWAVDGEREFEALIIEAFLFAVSTQPDSQLELILTAPGSAVLPKGVRRAVGEFAAFVPGAAAVLCFDLLDVSGARAVLSQQAGVPVIAPALGVWPEVLAAGSRALSRLTVDAVAAAMLRVTQELEPMQARTDEPAPAQQLASVYDDVLLRPSEASLRQRGLLASLLRLG